jgi:hypothetical protein
MLRKIYLLLLTILFFNCSKNKIYKPIKVDFILNYKIKLNESEKKNGL